MTEPELREILRDRVKQIAPQIARERSAFLLVFDMMHRAEDEFKPLTYFAAQGNFLRMHAARIREYFGQP